MKIGWVKMHGQRRIGILLDTYTRRLYFQLVFFGFFLEFETLNPQLKSAVLAGNKEKTCETELIFDFFTCLCDEPATVKRDGKWRCRLHDPEDDMEPR